MKKLNLKKIPKRKEKTKTLLVDGKFLAYRSKYTSNIDLSYNSVNTTMYYTFFNTLLSCAKKLETNKCVITWDIGEKSVRREQFPEYKSKKQNKKLTDYEIELNKQFKEEYHNLVNYCNEVGFYGNFLEGYEADDLIALYCYFENDEEIYIVSKDEDLFQCLKENVSLYDVDKKQKRTDKWFRKEHQLEPTDWNMVKAIGGCTSDNLKPIEGIGEKTAIKYLNDSISQKQKEKIEENWKIIERYLTAVSLPHPSLKNYKFKFKQSDMEPDGFIKFCQKNGFRQFLDNLWEFEKYFSIS